MIIKLQLTLKLTLTIHAICPASVSIQKFLRATNQAMRQTFSRFATKNMIRTAVKAQGGLMFGQLTGTS